MKILPPVADLLLQRQSYLNRVAKRTHGEGEGEGELKGGGYATMKLESLEWYDSMY